MRTHQVHVRRINLETDEVLIDEIEPFYSIYNAQRRLNDILEKAEEEQLPYHLTATLIEMER